MKKELRAEAIGQLSLDLRLASERQGGRHGACSTEYVRGREAGEPGDPLFAGIANRNVSFLLQ